MLTKLYEQWQNNAWVNNTRYTYTYDVNGNMLTVRFETSVTQNEVAYAVTGENRLKSEVIRVRGQLADLLVNVIGLIDYVSMDLKLPSSTGEPAIWDQHAAFLRICRDHAIPTYAKAVVAVNTPDAEIERCARLVADAWPEIPLVLQPVTPFGLVREAPRAARILEMQRRAMALLRDVRVIPQTHRLVGAR